MSSRLPVYAFDIDGTIADSDHRAHFVNGATKDWARYYDACPADRLIGTVATLARDLGRISTIVYVTGRSEVVRSSTLDWLNRHGLPDGMLFMRDLDFDGDDPTKATIIQRVLQSGIVPTMAFDDRAEVLAVWRMNGVHGVHVPKMGRPAGRVSLRAKAIRPSHLVVRAAGRAAGC